MSGTPASNASLSQLYFEIYKIHKQLNTFNNATKNEHIQRAMQYILEAEHKIDVISIFSDNEALDDIPTSHLKFFLIHFYHAEFMSNYISKDIMLKIRYYKESLNKYTEFLDMIWNYNILEDSSKKYLPSKEKWQDSDPTSNFSREERIAMVKREKRVSSELENLRKLIKKDIMFENDGHELSHAVYVDEEIERKLWLLYIESAVINSFSNKRILNQEVNLLSMQLCNKGKPNDDDDGNVGIQHDEIKEKHNNVKLLVNTLAQQLNKSASIKEKVFKPSHNLPTKTLESQAEYEIKLSENMSKGEEIKKKEDLDDSYKEREERYMDDWRDEHPRGYGNSKLRPCAQ